MSFFSCSSFLDFFSPVFFVCFLFYFYYFFFLFIVSFFLLFSFSLSFLSFSQCLLLIFYFFSNARFVFIRPLSCFLSRDFSVPPPPLSLHSLPIFPFLSSLLSRLCSSRFLSFSPFFSVFFVLLIIFFLFLAYFSSFSFPANPIFTSPLSGPFFFTYLSSSSSRLLFSPLLSFLLSLSLLYFSNFYTP